MTITDQLIDAHRRARIAGAKSMSYRLSDQTMALLEQEMIASMESVSVDAGQQYAATVELERAKRHARPDTCVDAGTFRGFPMWNDRKMVAGWTVEVER